jgi:hypothetical protein
LALAVDPLSPLLPPESTAGFAVGDEERFAAPMDGPLTIIMLKIFASELMYYVIEKYIRQISVASF